MPGAVLGGNRSEVGSFDRARSPGVATEKAGAQVHGTHERIFMETVAEIAAGKVGLRGVSRAIVEMREVALGVHGREVEPRVPVGDAPEDAGGCDVLGAVDRDEIVFV